MEEKTHKNIYYEVDKHDIYDIDNMSRDENKEWLRRAFERKLEYIYDTKINNSMTCILENELNNIDECNLLHDILNHVIRTKI